MLNIPATSKAAVITAMKAIGDAHQAKKEYGLGLAFISP